MDALPDWVGNLEVRLGHRSLLEAALLNARVPKASTILPTIPFNFPHLQVQISDRLPRLAAAPPSR